MARSSDRFLIWGAGGHGKVVADLIRACGHQVVGYVDADESKRGWVVEPGGAKAVLSEQELMAALAEQGAPLDGVDALALAIGDNQARLSGLERLGRTCVPALVHPSAVVSPSASVGRGSVIFAGAVVNAGAQIGRAVIVNTAAVVEHDCVVEDGAHLSPHATLAGGVRLGSRAWVGAGATIIQNIQIGADAIIGAGSVIIRDVPAGCTVVGVPGAPIRR